MNLTLIFPDVNRKKTYNSPLRKYNVYLNSSPVFELNQDSAREGELNVKDGDKIYITKRFGYNKKVDSHFYYIVGQDRAELMNQDGKKKYVAVDVEDNMLFVLDDNDFKKAIHIGK